MRERRFKQILLFSPSGRSQGKTIVAAFRRRLLRPSAQLINVSLGQIVSRPRNLESRALHYLPGGRGSPLLLPRPSRLCPGSLGAGRRGGGEGDPGSEVRGQGSRPDDRRCPRDSGQQMDLCCGAVHFRWRLRSRAVQGGVLCGRGTVQPVPQLAKAASCLGTLQLAALCHRDLARSLWIIWEAAGSPIFLSSEARGSTRRTPLLTK